MKGAADTDFEAAPTYVDSKSKQEGANADVTLAQYIEPDLHVLRKVIRKIDYRLLPTLSVLYLFAYLDRSAVANASIFGFRTDINITSTQYTLISSIFFIPYSLLEIPSNIIVTYVRPSLWIAILCLAWGITMTLSGLVQNFNGAMAARFFLGVTEAGFFPAAVTLVGDWYPREQLQSRISAFYVVGVFSGAFAGLIAYGIHYLDGVGGLASWRWIFILEGIATCCMVPLLFFVLSDYPSTTKWLTVEEKEAIVASRAATGNVDHAHFQKEFLVATLKHYKTYMITWIYGSINVILFGFSYTLPTILTQLGYKAETAQLMTVPLYGGACIVTFVTSVISDRIGKRSPVIICGLIVSLVGLVMLFTLPKDKGPIARYIGCLLVLIGGYPAIPGTLAWNSNNCETGGIRNISVAFQLCFGNLASIIGINAYMGKEAPYYWAGFGVAIGAASSAIIMAITLVFLLHRENNKFDEKASRGHDTGFRYCL